MECIDADLAAPFVTGEGQLRRGLIVHIVAACFTERCERKLVKIQLKSHIVDQIERKKENKNSVAHCGWSNLGRESCCV